MKHLKRFMILLGLSSVIIAASSCQKQRITEISSDLTAQRQSSSTGQSQSKRIKLTPPTPAAEVGFNTLTFSDEFNSLSTIDVNTTKQAGFNWYTDLPFGGNRTEPSAYSVSNGVLTCTSTGWTANWALSSYSPQGNVGHSFHFGYFEAKIKFNPNLGDSSQGWPAFWSLSTNHTVNGDPNHWAELDFFEAYTGGNAQYDGSFVGTMHDWADNSTIHWQNSNNFMANPGVDYNQWHTYGCLWTPGKVTWYFDGVAKMTQKYSATGVPDPLANGLLDPLRTGVGQNGVFNILDTDPQGMLLILGSSPGWPMDVDYVHLWQQ